MLGVFVSVLIVALVILIVPFLGLKQFGTAGFQLMPAIL
jgi:hypothetical protein